MPELPRVHVVEQAFARPIVGDAVAATRRALAQVGLAARVRRGQRVGITVGSRGIQNLHPILRTIAEEVRALGGEPRFLAAMGSHGGGTERGQAEVLDSLGLTEAALGAPVVPCASCEVVGTSPSGLPVHTVRSALEVDALLVVNRVKAHTSFRGQVESGIAKKLVVGLGGPKGAQQFHGFGPGELARLLVEISEVVLAKLPVAGGIAIVENAYEETAHIEGIPADGLVAREARVLELAKSLAPALPVERLHLLVVQEMGKNFSGTGVDTNVVGRARIHGVREPAAPDVQRLAVLDLTEASHGNATGVGLADFVTKRLVDKIDRKKTYLNCLTSTFVVRAAIPMWFDTERELFDAALYSLSGVRPDALRVAIIPNTLYLARSLVSEACLPELRDRPGVTVHPEPTTIRFDEAGNMMTRIGE